MAGYWEERPTEWDYPEPDVDVCTNCGAYFDWGGVMRKQRLAEMGVQDGAYYQRCFKCLSN